MITQSQLAAAIRNMRKDALHEWRMAHEPGYKERIEREARDYEKFCELHGNAEQS